jgi:hypothetical protein
MIQEQTISGGRQSGKSYSAMKLAIDAAKAGERVLFDCDSRGVLRERFAQMQQLAPPEAVAKVWLANGNERIRFRSGGEIVMVKRAARGGRGLTADVHVIDHDQDRDDVEVNPTVQRVIRTKLTPA